MNIVALIMLSIGAAGFVYRLLRGPSLPDRVVGLDGLLSVLVVGIIVGAARSSSGVIIIETVLVAVFVGFVGTTVLSRFIERRGS
ncbi:MAG TPA: monovalent cation/H+ antiporter complex subunit F [Ilumatobacteraceae bacterium]|nr:monovalent cation/H+ antiporter complex subunit F [Ilumatobacteraceae bacterium]